MFLVLMTGTNAHSFPPSFTVNLIVHKWLTATSVPYSHKIYEISAAKIVSSEYPRGSGGGNIFGLPAPTRVSRS